MNQTYDTNGATGTGVPPYAPRFTISPPICSLNPATTYESPFFWLILGAAGAGVVFYLIKKGHL